MCSSFLEPAGTCPFSWFPGSQTPAALAYTISTCKQLGATGSMLCPLTQLETLRAAKESSSSFSSSPPLGSRLSSRVVSHPQLTPALLLGWPQDPVQVQKPRAEGPPKSKSCSHWETVWATTDGAQVPRSALGLGEEFEQTLATCCPLEARGVDRE